MQKLGVVVTAVLMLCILVVAVAGSVALVRTLFW